jgi:branched-chain amino acid transport system ATP-binding protein
MAIVPQGRRLFPTLTVDEHLMLAARAGRAGNWTAERVYAEWPRLAECRRRRPGELSGGEQQILAIGRAVVTNPRLLLLDEPSEGLSPVHAQHLLAALRQLSAEGLAIVLVEQNLRLAFAAAREVVVMEKGRVVHRSEVETFRRDAATARRLLGVG